MGPTLATFLEKAQTDVSCPHEVHATQPSVVLPRIAANQSVMQTSHVASRPLFGQADVAWVLRLQTTLAEADLGLVCGCRHLA